VIADGWGGREGPLGWEASPERVAKGKCAHVCQEEWFVFVCS